MPQKELKLGEGIIELKVRPWEYFYFNRVLKDLVVHPNGLLAELKPREALIIAPHIVVEADRPIDTIHSPDIEPESLLILRHIELQVGPLNDTISVALLCHRVNLVRPLALKALQVVTLHTHRIVSLTA